MSHRPALVQALEILTAARRDAQDEYDTHLLAKLSAPPSGDEQDEQDEQSRASIVRLFGDAAKAVRDAVACSDRLEARRQPTRGV